MKYRKALRDGIKAAFKGKTALKTLAVSSVFYILVTLASFPQYSLQLLGRNILYLDEAVVSLTFNTFSSAGALGLGLTVAYSVLTGVALVNIVEKLRISGLASSKDLATIIPGLTAAGCASCGVGILAFIGLGGTLALMPFNGNLIRVLAVGLLLGVITKNGDPTTCLIDE
ncbi:hypothetical protein [Candidatus Nanohalococcus occultus]|uniref:Membrane protein n=1 Tax=Candidatus Nanohalococcus occultus TaxID=2978047 RepID=A0ABY8CGP7_9ARCH|nr:putative membrane protein [Candidatus Nanohaloarchaeota archaeon SVXNc]